MTVYLYDAVSLEHFAAAGRLDILQQLHASSPEPRWTEEVHDEVAAGAGLLASASWCQPVLDMAWLGEPSTAADLVETLRLHALLSNGSDEGKHLGEAQSITLAKAIGATFVTDDSGAYDYAFHSSVLGAGRVVDCCELLWEASTRGIVLRADVVTFHEKVFDSGRTMRCRCQLWPSGMSLDDKLRKMRRGGDR